jgi:hypothetical protein
VYISVKINPHHLGKLKELKRDFNLFLRGQKFNSFGGIEMVQSKTALKLTSGLKIN